MNENESRFFFLLNGVKRHFFQTFLHSNLVGSLWSSWVLLSTGVTREYVSIQAEASHKWVATFLRKELMKTAERSCPYMRSYLSHEFLLSLLHGELFPKASGYHPFTSTLRMYLLWGPILFQIQWRKKKKKKCVEASQIVFFTQMNVWFPG